MEKVVGIPLAWWERIKRAVAGFENLPTNAVSPRKPQASNAVQPVVTIQVTGGTANANGYYPGKVVRKNSATNVWEDLATPPIPISVASPTGATLTNGAKVRATLSGVDPTDGVTYAFLTTDGGGAAATYVNITSAAPNANGYYPGTLDTYSAGVWTTGAAVSVKNLEGRALAAGHRVVAFAAGLDGTTPAYLTEAGGLTGTIAIYVSQTCVNNQPVVTFTTATIVNGVIVSNV